MPQITIQSDLDLFTTVLPVLAKLMEPGQTCPPALVMEVLHSWTAPIQNRPQLSELSLGQIMYFVRQQVARQREFNSDSVRDATIAILERGDAFWPNRVVK